MTGGQRPVTVRLRLNTRGQEHRDLVSGAVPAGGNGMAPYAAVRPSLRIPMKSAADSDRNWPPIPTEAGR